MTARPYRWRAAAELVGAALSAPLGGYVHLFALLSVVSLTAVLTVPWTRHDRTHQLI
ncbi:hypothetical protein [Streptomyces sp. NPDC058424]|uniref:hypothetical protein n=1 Tax=Streptomyces sp. NPDC058424 TaxID=3346491 RepID=UPI003656CD2D